MVKKTIIQAIQEAGETHIRTHNTRGWQYSCRKAFSVKERTILRRLVDALDGWEIEDYLTYKELHEHRMFFLFKPVREA